MRFIETPLPGAYVVEIEPIEDERGFFARAWCEDELRGHGLDARLAQCNLSYNRKRGTLRGMHFQPPPHAETKIVRCTRGSIYDVIVDLRTDSPTRGGWFGAELSADNRRAIYIPQDFAHGFVTLEDDSDVFYQMSRTHVIDAGCGVRWNDPAIAIQWPIAPVVISERDSKWPLLGSM